MQYAYHVYEIEGDRLITKHIISDQQNRIIAKEEHKRKESVSWMEYRDKLLREFGCEHMLHFINGVLKENPRYKKEQLKAIYNFLLEEHPSLVFLEKVLAFCVADHIWRYHVSEFEEVFNSMKKEASKAESIDKLQQSLRDKFPMEVEARDCASYAARVRQLTMEG